jgi:hypothetical protein
MNRVSPVASSRRESQGDGKSRIGPAAEEDSNDTEDGENALSHEMTLEQTAKFVIASQSREDSNH